jgi:co-chaperonin GroES (HSP10)
MIKKDIQKDLGVKKGDWVIFARYAGSRIQIDGGEVRLLNDDEILATIENPEDIFHQY